MSYMTEYEKWLASDAVSDEAKSELRSLSEKEIEDRFYKELEFGTAGLRGIMGAGTNRMNIYTVRKTTQGICLEIIDNGQEAMDKGVVVAYDSRNNSALFALECAKVLCANGIKTYLFDSLRPTPELSFALRHLGCARGIVITASHNPKEYNGYKAYGEDGGQLPPEVADVVVGYINKIDIFSDIKITEDPQYISIGEDVDRAYIDAVKEQSLGVKIPEDFKVVYTPLHGSGNLLVRRVLDEIGAKNVFVVPQQEKPDGNFPTVVSPNPENAEAFTLAIEYAKEQNADIVFGTDPDSDRIGVVVRKSDGSYAVLSGNQTGSLLCEFILRKRKENGTLPSEGAVIKTIVTTEMIRAVADSFGVETIDVLTGFKFIGEKIKEFEAEGKYDKYLFGLEESYGYLKGSYARDKDAVVASMLVCELAAELKSQGKTLYDGLIDLYEKYGYFVEVLETKTLTGIEGIEKIREIMHKFRNSQLPLDIERKLDYSQGIDGLPKSDVLKFFLADGSWFAVRPSGTEPKIKFYFGVCGEAWESAQEKAQALKDKVCSLI
ncbi:MAG: phospho-sugar mutase [Ruminococcaceae bacterium]|nr:phospho-sugar mutase [Oscillospiraceae bacterium]